MPRLLLALRIAAAIAAVLVLALLAWQCIDIYLDGNVPDNLDANGVHLTSVYSMTDVSLRLKRFAAPLIGCLFVIAVSSLMHAFFHHKEKPRVAITSENRLRLIKARVEELPEQAKSEERYRLICRCIAGVVMAACFLPCAVYLCDGGNFSSWDLEAVMGTLMIVLVPVVFVVFSIAINASFLCQRSMEREIALLKDVTAAKKTKGVDPKSGRQVNALRIVLYAVCVVLIAAGVMNGGLRDVLVKAINICTECIGLG